MSLGQLCQEATTLHSLGIPQRGDKHMPSNAGVTQGRCLLPVTPEDKRHWQEWAWPLQGHKVWDIQPSEQRFVSWFVLCSRCSWDSWDVCDSGFEGLPCVHHLANREKVFARWMGTNTRQAFPAMGDTTGPSAQKGEPTRRALERCTWMFMLATLPLGCPNCPDTLQGSVLLSILLQIQESHSLGSHPGLPE